MAQRERPLSPFLHYRWQYTNTLSILHRITGVLLSLGFCLLVYWLAAAAGGPEQYARAVGVLGSPLFQVLLFGAAFAFCYHLLNGIRHLFFDAGNGFELATARRNGYATAVGAVALALAVWFAVRAGLGLGSTAPVQSKSYRQLRDRRTHVISLAQKWPRVVGQRSKW